MGAANNIKGSNISFKLPDLTCPQCSQQFTEQEITDRNFDLWFDNSNDVGLEPLAKGYQLSIWIRSIEHESCPDVRECESCYSKFLEKELKADNEWGMTYYCPPCWKERNKEKGHE